MCKRTAMRWLALSMLVMGLVLGTGLVPMTLGGSLAQAADTSTQVQSVGWWGVKKPQIPKGKGKTCVRDTEFMRRNHMDMLLHQRDETMHRGIRTKQYSLNECITCHAVKGSDGKAVTVKDPKHFCRVCHDFVSVQMDCFECHASRPVDGASSAAFAPGQGLPVGHKSLTQIRLDAKKARTSDQATTTIAVSQNSDLAALADFLRSTHK